MELKLNSNSTIFFDTIPFIYYFEDHVDYGQVIDQHISSFNTRKRQLFNIYRKENIHFPGIIRTN
ncbi:MAG: hypothetical protein KAQ69_10845 [Spirochaetales bacterium]|nr:hypothetical protein [Spirochaetales bacterium]